MSDNYKPPAEKEALKKMKSDKTGAAVTTRGRGRPPTKRVIGRDDEGIKDDVPKSTGLIITEEIRDEQIQEEEENYDDEQDGNDDEEENSGEDIDDDVGIPDDNYEITFRDPFVEIHLNNFSKTFTRMIKTKSCPHLIPLKDFKFRCGELGWKINTLHLEDIVKYRIPFFDLLVYKQFKVTNPEINFKVDLKLKGQKWKIGDLNSALTVLFFNLLVRGRATIGEATQSAIITQFMSIEETEESLFSMLTCNKIGFLEHKWIKSCDITSFSPVLANRLKLGVCGHRMLNVFTQFPVTRKDLSPKVKELLPLLRDLSLTGPHWTLHPLFKHDLIKHYSITSCFGNIILEAYTKEEIKTMVEAKALFGIPKRRVLYDQWITWDRSLFEALKSDPIKIDKAVGEDKEEVDGEEKDLS